jgi:Co/Zn/Cd efflux system component
MLKFQFAHAALFVLLANLLYFIVEFYIGKNVASVSLFADSIDFLEDAAVNFIVLVSLYFSFKIKKYVSILLALMLLLPAGAAFYTAFEKIFIPSVPLSSSLALTSCGALAVNLVCAIVLAKFKNTSGSLSKAAFLSSRNDAIANFAMIFAAGLTSVWPSIWPDLLVGLAIASINLDSAKEIFETVNSEN